MRSFVLRYKAPYGGESQQFDALQHDHPVRVYRNTCDTWEGPLTFVSKDGETFCVQLIHRSDISSKRKAPKPFPITYGRNIFRSRVVKPDQSTDMEKDISCALLASDLPSKIETLPGDAICRMTGGGFIYIASDEEKF